jgi:hypothetical protein
MDDDLKLEYGDDENEVYSGVSSNDKDVESNEK